MRPTSLIATGTVRQRDLVRDAADCRPQGDGAVPVVDHGQVLAGTGEEIHDRLAGRRVGRSGKGVGSRRLTIAVHYLSRTPTPRGVTCSSPESLTAGNATSTAPWRTCGTCTLATRRSLENDHVPLSLGMCRRVGSSCCLTREERSYWPVGLAGASGKGGSASSSGRNGKYCSSCTLSSTSTSPAVACPSLRTTRLSSMAPARISRKPLRRWTTTRQRASQASRSEE